MKSKKTRHGNRRRVRVVKILAVLECSPDFLLGRDIGNRGMFCLVYEKPCRLPFRVLHLSCMNCFGLLAQNKRSSTKHG